MSETPSIPATQDPIAIFPAAASVSGRRFPRSAVASDVLRTGRPASDAVADRALEQAAVVALGRRALEGGDLTSLLSQAATLVVSTLGVEFCGIFEMADDKRFLTVRAAAGWNAEAPGARLPMDAAAAWVLACAQPVLSEDLVAESRFPIHAGVLNAGVVSAVALRIAGFQQTFGILAVGTLFKRVLDEDELNFLHAIVNVLAMEIRRKTLEKQVLEAADRERGRFGQELHDGVSQALTGIGLMAMVLQRRLASLQLPEAAQAGQIFEHLRDASAMVRGVARGLSPVDVDVGGLHNALEELAGDVQRRGPMECHFKAGPDTAIEDAAQAGHLFQIAREALNNVVRHSRASTVSLSLRRRGAHFILSVADDGIGLPKKVARGMGLQTMEYRAALMNGALSVSGAGKSGTRIVCTVPVVPAPKP